MSPKPQLSVGMRAPQFRLMDESGHAVALRDFKGKKNVILVFYPGDMTPGCTMQLCAIRDDWKKFVSTDTALFGVNHADAESHKKFVKKYNLPLPLLIDPGKKVSARYGAIKTFFKAKVIKRSVVGIGKDGKIFFLRRGMPKDADILKAAITANAKAGK
jgi:thioredoxin-dependent peroxiredoxin